MAFQVDMNEYCGPMELLLYLVRREELPLSELSLSKLTEQYLEYLEVLTELSIDDVADFLEIASVLIEMKAKAMLPQSPLAAGRGSDRAGGSERSAYPTVDGLQTNSGRSQYPGRTRANAGNCVISGWRTTCRRAVPNSTNSRCKLSKSGIWSVRFGRILRERQPPPQTNVVYDDTPIHVYMERIHGTVNSNGRVELTSLFEPGMHKSSLVAMFLATLELTRHYGLKTEQREPGLPLYLVADENFSRELDVHRIENLSFEKVANSNLPVTPR